jgi:hypothetical protein
MRVEVSLETMCAVVCAAGLFVGCSFIFTSAPKDDKDDRCSTSYLPPVLDTVSALLELGFVAYQASGSETGFERARDNRELNIALGVGFTVLYGASAVYGYATVGKCRSQKKRLAEEEKRAQIVDQPPVPRGWSSPPEGAVGFRFGSTVAEAQQACVGAGHRWTAIENAHSCSGAGTPIVQSPASVYLVFCAERLCRIDIAVHPKGMDARAAVAVFGELRQAITGLYGTPIHSNIQVPDQCKAESAFLDCLRRGQARGDVRWQWPTGHAVALEVIVDQAGQPIVGARFSLPGAAAPPTPAPAPPAAVQPPQAEPDAGANTVVDAGAIAPNP